MLCGLDCNKVVTRKRQKIIRENYLEHKWPTINILNTHSPYKLIRNNQSNYGQRDMDSQFKEKTQMANIYVKKIQSL